MEALNYKKIITLACCCMLTMLAWAAPKEKFEKVIDKEFSIANDGKVHLQNKYGDVNITTTNTDKVSLHIRIIVNASSKEKADATFDRINIEFSNSSDYVSAITTIGEADKSWFGWSSSSGGDFQIHYNVQMPQSNALELHNKYGNSYVGELDGTANVEVKYGNLKMDDVNDNVNLTLGYGNATLGNSEGMTMEVKYSTVEVDGTADISANTKYSKVIIGTAEEITATTKYDNYKIGNIESFRCDGKYDHFKIDKVASVKANCKYTSYKIGTLTKSAHLDMEYGGASIANVASDFSEIEVEGRYTDYKFAVTNGANYHMDVESDYAGIRYPSAMQVVQHIEDGSEEELEGYVGGKSAASVIKARLDYGSIKVEEN